MGQTFRLFQEVTTENIKKIFIRSLGESQIWSASLMDGGLFNTTYHVTYGAERKEAALRLGPVNRQFLMGHEENLMRAGFPAPGSWPGTAPGQRWTGII